MRPEDLALRLISPRRQPDAPAPAQTLACAGVDLAIHLCGDPAAKRRALLIHGWDADHRDLAGYAQALAAQGFYCVAPDLPAHGRSSGDSMTLPEGAAAIVEATRAFGPFDLCVAHSVGCAIAMQASAAAPIAEKFVLLAPPLNYAWQTRAAAAAAGAPAPLIEAALQVLRVRCPQFDEIDSEKLAAQLKGQALIIGAERDRVVDPDNARKIALRWPGARSFMASQASHRSILTDPATQAAALEFIAL